jgi:hypothetical protein
MLRVLFLIAVVCLAPFAHAAPQRAAAARGLSTTVREFHVRDATLRDVVEQLRQLSGSNILVNWPALEAVGVLPELPVTLRLQNVTVERILRAVIDLVGADVIGYGIDQGVVEVTLRDVLEARLITRVYNIGDLLIEPADFSANAPNLDISRATQVGAGGSQSLFSVGGGSSNNREDARAERLEELVELVTTVIDPDLWAVNGGRSRIFAYDRYLVITAPESTHRKLLRR